MRSGSLVLALFLAAQVNAAAPPVVGRDLYGDPLPHGAVARLGSMRLRHLAPFNRVALSRDGSLVASMEYNIRIWDRKTGRLLRDLEHNHFMTWAVAFTADGKGLASAHTLGAGNQVLLWDLATGKQRPLWQAKQGRLWAMPKALAFSPDGKMLAVVWSVGGRGETDDRVRLYAYPSGKEQGEIPLAEKPEINAVAFSGDSKSVVFGMWNSLRFHDPATRKEQKRITTGRHPYTLTVSPDGKTIAVTGYRGPVTFVHLGTKDRVVTSEVKAKGIAAVGFSRDGKELYFAGEVNEPVLALDPETGKQLRKVAPAETRGMGMFHATAAGGSWVVRFDGSTVKVYDARTGKLAHGFDDHRDGSPLEAAVSPDGRRIATRSETELRIWELRTGKMLRRIGVETLPGMRWAEDGKAVVAGQKNKLYWWDVGTGKVVREAALPSGTLLRASFLRGGTRISCLLLDEKRRRRFVVANLSAPEKPWLYSGEEHRSLASPDGAFVLTTTYADNGETARLIDTKSGKPVWTQPLSGSIQAHTFSSNGDRLAALGYQGLIVWRTKTGRKVGGGTFAKEDQYRQTVDLTPSGRMTIVGKRQTRTWNTGFQSAPRTHLDLLETATGQVRHRFPLLPQISSTACTPDGRYLVTASADGSALVWPLYDLTSGTVTPRAWDDLGGADAKTAFAVVCGLIAAPDKAIALLGQRLRPAACDVEQVRRWLENLDSESFAVREDAERRLAALGEDVEEDLHEALAKKPSVEMRTRLMRLVHRLEEWNADRLRQTRALEVLEMIGSPEAMRLLEKLAGGYRGSRLTIETRETLARLKARR
jgi:WD40 repeat protein